MCRPSPGCTSRRWSRTTSACGGRRRELAPGGTQIRRQERRRPFPQLGIAEHQLGQPRHRLGGDEGQQELHGLAVPLVDPPARGLGIGARLVGQCLDFARSVGYERIVRWTNHPLVAARRLYEAAGFRLVAEQAARLFGHDLVSQSWALEL